MNRIIVRKSILENGIEEIDEEILFKSMFRLLESDFGNLSEDVKENQKRLLDEGKIEGNAFLGLYEDQHGQPFNIKVLNGYATIYR